MELDLLDIGKKYIVFKSKMNLQKLIDNQIYFNISDNNDKVYQRITSYLNYPSEYKIINKLVVIRNFGYNDNIKLYLKIE